MQTLPAVDSTEVQAPGPAEGRAWGLVVCSLFCFVTNPQPGQGHVLLWGERQHDPESWLLTLQAGCALGTGGCCGLVGRRTTCKCPAGVSEDPSSYLSLQPCMHTFCAACYSGWMERSTLCPTCRCPVERICKNHILNNLVEAYLLQHPGK